MKPLSPLSKLRERVLELSFKHKLSHIGSCLTMLPILYEIYSIKKEDEKVILSAGHAALALYVILEDLYGFSAEKMLEDWGIHQEIDISRKVYSSGGSLGQGILIATGIAMANKNKDIYCATTDGDLSEGSCWEALNLKDEYKLNNLKIFVNANSWSAYKYIDTDKLEKKLHTFCDNIKVFKTNSDMPFAKGLEAHYQVMTNEDYESML